MDGLGDDAAVSNHMGVGSVAHGAHSGARLRFEERGFASYELGAEAKLAFGSSRCSHPLTVRIASWRWSTALAHTTTTLGRSRG